MTGNWLVIDLRFNRCSIGLLSYGPGSETMWVTRPVETFVDPLTSPHSKDEVSLSFFRKIGERSWNPVEMEIIEELPDTYEVIESLFNAPDEYLDKQFPRIMNHLLKTPLKEFKDIPLLFLVDTERAKSLIDNLLEKKSRKSEVKLLTRESEYYAGFTLIDITNGTLPKRNEKYLCQIEESEEKRISVFTWMGISFRYEEASNSGQLDVRYWDSMNKMIRVGAALYALLWQPVLEERIQVEMICLREQINAKQELLGRMENLLFRLKGVPNKQVSTI